MPPKERTVMAQTMFKCFTCGRVYKDEESAVSATTPRSSA